MDSQPFIKIEDPFALERQIVAKGEGQSKRQFRRKDCKKLICPQHGHSYKLKCEFNQCQKPYICSNPECMDQHFHTGVITMSKFNGRRFAVGCQEAEKAQLKVDVYYSRAMEAKAGLDNMRTKLNELMGDMKHMNNLCQGLHQTLNDRLTKAFINSLDNLFSTQQKIAVAFEDLKAAIVFPDEQKNKEEKMLAERKGNQQEPVLLNSYESININSQAPVLLEKEALPPLWRLLSFIQTEIAPFTLKKMPLFVGTLDPTNLQDFHRQLVGREHLIFVFETKTSILGAYFRAGYPPLTQSTLKDPNSFIFISEPTNPTAFEKLAADSEATEHLKIDNKLSLCIGSTSQSQGLRLSHTYETVSYSLPTSVFASSKTEKKFEGVQELVLITVLQGQNNNDLD